MAQQNLKDEPPLLLLVEQVKYRKTGPGKSPLGSFRLFEDRVEWTSNSDEKDQQLVYFSNVKGQRISPPNKPKVQLQLLMLNGDQATFVFMNSALSAEELLKERDLVKETLQQALVRHRQLVSQLAQKTSKGGTDREQEAKVKILEQNAHLYQMYLHLVKQKLISAQDFWSFHYKSPEEQTKKDGPGENDAGQVGVSGGFLSTIVQSESVGGIRLNLTTETIQSIFRTYPSVERKHLELVPHEMSEQEFWSKFFQSHYFHRDRTVAASERASKPSSSGSSSDPFADCVQWDEKDMIELMEKSKKTLKRQMDLSYIDEDLGILSEMRSSQLSVRGSSEAKRLLVRRCNYHSERVLGTMLAGGQPSMGTGVGNGNTMTAEEQQMASCNGTESVQNKEDEEQIERHVNLPEREFDLDLESMELAQLDIRREEFLPLTTQKLQQHQPKVTVSGENELARQALLDAAERSQILNESSQLAFFDLISTRYLDDSDGEDAAASSSQFDESQLSATSFHSMGRADVERVRMVHCCLAELLRHFWACFPPRTPELEQKLRRMDEALKRFEEKQLNECEQRFGAIYVRHCREQLAKARQQFQTFNSQQ